MKSFVVMTYYQLMHSIAMALTLDEKPMLYFSKSYLDVQDDLLDRIRESGVFHDVVGITARGDFIKFIAELNKTKDYTPEEVDEVGDSIFEKHLEPMYAEPFKDADFEDTIYIYNDFQWHFYYINKHFKHIVGIEDGYASLKQQLKIHSFKGDHELAIKFLGKYFPEPLYRSPKIKEIISSKPFDDIPDEYKDKIHVLDFNDLIHLHFEQYKAALLYIFEIADYEIEDDSVLFLSQPLSRARYCNSLQEYLMYKKILRNEVLKGHTVYFKAHPADTIDPLVYRDKNIHILPKSFPVELLNYKNCSFQKVLSFGSTGVKTLTCAGSFEKIFPNQDAEKDEIEQFIINMIEDESATLEIVYLVNQLNTETYINVYSGYYPLGSQFGTEVKIVVPADIKDRATDYFDKKRLGSEFSKYKKGNTKDGVLLWEAQLNRIKSIEKTIRSPQVLACDDLFSEASVIQAISEENGSYDYILLTSGNNPMFSVVKNIMIECRSQFVSCITFQNYTKIPERKIAFSFFPAAPSYIERKVLGTILNVVWHRSLFEELIGKSEADRVRTIENSCSALARKFSNDLYTPYELYSNIADGFSYYLEKANMIIATESDDPETMTVLLAKEVFCYLDWLKVNNNKASSLDEFISQVNCPEEIKRKVLEKVCLTLYFEHNKRYKKSADDNYVIGQHLLKEKLAAEKASKKGTIGKKAIKHIKKMAR